MLRPRGAMFVLAVVAVLALTSVAWAGNVEGQIKSVDPSGHMVTLADGTVLTITPATRVDKNALKPGANVKASFEEKGGEKMATSILVTPPAK